MPVQDLLEGLDKEQEKAVTLKTNGVAAAGAGSGKTRVLASRYAWLVTEKNLKPEEILTLTFTNKAVSEMYSRIYRSLLEQSDPVDAASADTELGRKRAAEALREFHKARISTLDSFSAGVARTAAARYGLSPDFSSDDAALRELAEDAALSFVLDNREAPAIRGLLVDHKIRKIANEIFARVVLKYSPISSPLELDRNLLKQKEAILKVWREKTRLAEEITEKITDALRELAEAKKSIGFTESLGGILLKSAPPSPPDIAPLLESAAANPDPDAETPQKTGGEIQKYFDYYSALMSIRLPGRYGEVYAPLVNSFRLLKGKDGDGLYHELESVANYALNFGLCAGVFELIKNFQNQFNAKKRETGFLSFNDIARLAVDALRDHPDIRKSYKDSLKMIMIDEFQDNNALQRDLVYLLAENSGRAEKGIAAPDELEKNRMFFVGDEKQSIYRFRGADVAVFRSLGKDLFQYSDPPERQSGHGGSIELKHNYRSRPRLIAAFNRIFGGLDEDSPEETGNGKGVFMPSGPDVPDYEAVYKRIYPPEIKDRKDDGARSSDPLTHFCFLNEEDIPEDGGDGIKSHDLEAAFIAKKIRDMVIKKEKIPRRTDTGTEWKECAWGDFAVLERAYTHQAALEKYFREFGIPYNTDRPSGLFSDAPIMDLRAYLRLLVYPEDRIAYAALIRSPFARLSDLTLSVCMLSKSAEPFAEENEALIPENEIELYRLARERYRKLREASRSLPVTELLTKLWFEEGYRFETLWAASAQVYEGLFDLFFSLANEADSRGKNLAEFIEYVEDLINLEEKPDDIDIPCEGESGVRIMSIHKSKGLEFPVVFIFDCTHSGNTRSQSGLISYHDEYGVILSIPQAEELPLGGNYFRNILREEEKAKDIAELRRLLYVAMTRAECALFLTFTMPVQTKEEKKIWDMAGEEFTEKTIRRRLVEYDEKSACNRNTFLKLLAGILPDCPPSLCGIETIPVLTRLELSVLASGAKKNKSAMSLKEAALTAESFYGKAEILPEGRAGPLSIDASKLRYKTQSPDGASNDNEPPPSSQAYTESRLDGLLEKAGLSAANFGSLVHAVLESRLDGRPDFIPPEIRSRVDDEKILDELLNEAGGLANIFLVSELGKRWAASDSRESEFSVVTSVIVKGKALAISGQIDLIFEEDDKTVVIDFKTDRIENPEAHYGQLAAYSRAAGDIFGKPVSAWLFYLRSGRAVDATDGIRSLSPEALTEAALS